MKIKTYAVDMTGYGALLVDASVELLEPASKDRVKVFSVRRRALVETERAGQTFCSKEPAENGTAEALSAWPTEDVEYLALLCRAAERLGLGK